jgi:hypothetical protein
MKTRLDSVNLLYFMSPISLGLLVPIMQFTEVDNIRKYWDQFGESNVIPILFVSGLIAFTLSTPPRLSRRLAAFHTALSGFAQTDHLIDSCCHH